MKGFYITGTKGSYIELVDGRWADTVSEDDGENRNVEELLKELTEQLDSPDYSYLTLDELKEYVGANDFQIECDTFTCVEDRIEDAIQAGRVTVKEPKASDLFRQDAALAGVWAISPYFEGAAFLFLKGNDVVAIGEGDKTGLVIGEIS